MYVCKLMMYLREAQLDSSLFERPCKLLQFLQVTGFLGVRGHWSYRGNTALSKFLSLT